MMNKRKFLKGFLSLAGLAIAPPLDRGKILYGILAEKHETENPWKQIGLEVWCDLGGFVVVGYESGLEVGEYV